MRSRANHPTDSEVLKNGQIWKNRCFLGHEANSKTR